MRVVNTPDELAAVARTGAARVAGGVRQLRRVSGKVHSAAAAHRSAVDGRQARQPGAPVRARLLGAAALSESGRDRAGPESRSRPCATRSARRRSRSAARSTTRTPARSSFWSTADTGKFYFIEVNPRIQVEHTVTEVGHRRRHRQVPDPGGRRAIALDDPEIGLGSQESIRTYGFAMQCRVTTEDPENRFLPDYGRIAHYRSAGGLGVRLDAGTAFSGAVVTPLLRFAAGQGHGLGTAIHRRGPAHGTRPAGIPHPRREDQHSVSDQPGHASQVHRRRLHDALHRRNARAVRVRSRGRIARRSCSATWPT